MSLMHQLQYEFQAHQVPRALAIVQANEVPEDILWRGTNGAGHCMGTCLHTYRAFTDSANRCTRTSAFKL